MAEETSRMKIPYPSQGQANYYEVFKSGMDAIDADIFALWSKANVIMHGGGAISWSLVGSDYEFTFADSIVAQIPSSGTSQSIAPTTLIVPPSHFVIFDIAFGATSTGSMFDSVATQISIDPSSTAFCWHNPTTHELVFSTGLVIALGGTATGIQPQGGGGSITVTDGSVTVNPATTITVSGSASVTDLGGGNAEITVTGGGSISVTDGTTTVNPTTAIDFTAGAVVTDAGGGSAEVLVPLTTQFVVAQDGTGLFTTIQDGIDAANAAWVTSGVDQIVFIRGGSYTENLTFKTGVRVVAEGNPNAKPDGNWVGVLNRSPASAVIVTGDHQFQTGVRLRTTIQGITFATAGSTLFLLSDTTASTYNTIQFFDCLLFGDSMGAGTYLFEVNGQDCPNLSLHFERCRLLFLSSVTGNYEPMLLLGSDGGDQDYTFVDCLFDTKGGTGRVVLRSDGGAGAGNTRFMRCNFLYCDLDNAGTAGFSAFASDLWLIDVVIDGPQRWPVAWNVVQNVYVTRCTLGSSLGGGYEAVDTGGNGSVLFDNLTYYPSYVTNTTRIANGTAVATYAVPARSIEGGTYTAGGTGTVDLDGLWTTGYNFTNVSWDTTIGGVGTREVQLHDAAKTQGMYVTVWDSGGQANTKNITVTSPTSAGGAIGPHTTIANASGSLTFVATVDASSQACWRSISYFH